jgi:hypothetical protein
MWIDQSTSANNHSFYVKNTHEKVRPLFCHFLKNLQKIRPLFLPAAEIFMGPLLCFAAEISASWQH